MNHDSTPTNVSSTAAAAEQPGLDLFGFLADFRAGLAPAPAAEESHRRQGFAPAAEPSEPWLEDPYVGSDVQVGPDWWMASDGRWYGPELHPERQVEVPPAEAEVIVPEVIVPEDVRREPEPARVRQPLSLPKLRRLRHPTATA